MNVFLPYRPQGSGLQPFIKIVLVAIGVGALAYALTSSVAQATVSIAEDDFEDSNSGPTGFGWIDDWEFEGNVSYRNSGGPHQGSSHLRLKNEDASAVRTVDVTGETSLRLQVWAKEDDFDDDSAVIEVSEDGSTYVELHEWDGDSDYSFYDFDLSETGLSFATQIWVRVRIVGDDDDGTLYIDDLIILNSADEPDPDPPDNGNPVLIDGQFSDWPGKANLTDAFDDQSGSDSTDIAAFYWANNIDEEINFHMIERHTEDGQPFDGSNGKSKKVNYIVFIDTNNNGNFSDADDRRAVIAYHPKKNKSKVKVKIYPGNSNSKISDSGWNDWGDSREDGGLRVEFPLDWNDLDIEFGGVIRMYAVSFTGKFSSPNLRDRVPDGNADIQWSPASVLGQWLLGAASIAGIAVIWFISRRRRLWT